MKAQNLAVLSALLAAAMSGPQAEAQDPGVPLPEKSGNPVLVELFTSQGCSSCPPAEDWLNGEGMELFNRGRILPLAFHVDYWDYLGWTDPFSSADSTGRQRRYARAFSSDSLYTPEMVVAGRVGFVGSEAGRARAEIRAAGDLPVKVLHLKKVSRGRGLEITLPEGLPQQGLRFYLAVFENGLTTKVQRGENAGRTLEENFVVRRLVEIQRKDGPGEGRWRVSLPGEVPLGDATREGVAVFGQEEATMRVFTAGCLYPLR